MSPDTLRGEVHLAERPRADGSTPTLNSINDHARQAKAQAVSPSCHLTTGQPEGAAFHGPSSGAINIGTAKDSSRILSSEDIAKNQLLAETTRQREYISLETQDSMLIQTRSTRKGQPQSRKA